MAAKACQITMGILFTITSLIRKILVVVRLISLGIKSTNLSFQVKYSINQAMGLVHSGSVVTFILASTSNQGPM